MVTRSGVKVGGQCQGIGHGVKSGEVWGPGRGSRSGKGSRFGGQGQGMGHGQRSRSCGHNVWGQGQGSRSWVKVSGVVKVMGRGSMSGGLGSDGRWGRLKINSLFLSRTHDRIEFHSIPIHSIPIHSIPCFTQCHSKQYIEFQVHVLCTKSGQNRTYLTLTQTQVRCTT